MKNNAIEIVFFSSLCQHKIIGLKKKPRNQSIKTPPYFEFRLKKKTNYMLYLKSPDPVTIHIIFLYIGAEK